MAECRPSDVAAGRTGVAFFLPCGAFQSAINVSTCERTACGNGPQLLALGICLHRSPRRHQLVSGYFPSRAAMNWGPAVFQAALSSNGVRPRSIGSCFLSSRATFNWVPAIFQAVLPSLGFRRLSFKPRRPQLGSNAYMRADCVWQRAPLISFRQPHMEEKNATALDVGVCARHAVGKLGAANHSKTHLFY